MKKKFSSFILLILLILLLTTAKVSQSSNKQSLHLYKASSKVIDNKGDHFFKQKKGLKGSKVELLRYTDQIAVTGDARIIDQTIEEVLQVNNFKNKFISPPSIKKFFRKKSYKNTHVYQFFDIKDENLITELMEELKHYPEVKFVTPVFYAYKGSMKILTDEIIIELTEEFTKSDLANINPPGIKITDELRLTPHTIYILTVENAKERDMLDIVTWYSEQDMVKWVSPNFITEVGLCWEPSDPNYNLQWHLKNIGQGGGTVDADVDANQAWDLTRGDPNIVIAIIDSGVEINHNDLISNIWVNPGEDPNIDGEDDDNNGFIDDIHGWNFISYNPDDPNNSPGDPNVAPEGLFHGTACAGVAASSNNNVGGVGVAPNVKILPVKILNSQMSATLKSVASAIEYAADHADILSCSWVLPIDSDPTGLIQIAINYASNNKDCPVLFASGNAASGFLVDRGMNLNPGTYTYRWRYIKDANNSDGDDCVWLDSIEFPNGTIENFENGIDPNRWITAGDNNGVTPPTDPNFCWIPENDNRHYCHGPDIRSARSGLIGDGQYSELSAVMQNPNAGIFKFSMWPSTQVQRIQEFLDPWQGVWWAQIAGDYCEVAVIDANNVTVTSINIAGGEVVAADPYRTYYIQYPGWGNWWWEVRGTFTSNLSQEDSISYPASCNNAISVGACTNTNYRSFYSQFDPNLDLCAPSNGGTLGIFTTDGSGANGYDPNSDYTDNFNGTSSACPLAAGIAALVLSSEPDLAWSEVHQRLRDTADKIGQFDYIISGRNDQYGYGKVNAYKALQADIEFANQVISSGTHTGNTITADPNVTIAGGAVVIFEATNSISAGSNFIIEENANVTFKAATITAEDNFVIKSGAKLTFETTGWIIAGPDFTIESGAEVIFKAGSYIRILNEFLAQDGCKFECHIL